MTTAAGLRLIDYDTPWGEGWMTVDHAGNVVRLGVPGSVSPDEDAVPTHGAPPDDAATSARELAHRLVRYFEGQGAVELASRDDVERWLRAAGIVGFRLRVLLELHAVPYGVTITYGELAELAGSPRAARAAGSACAHNPLPLVIPCHRVVAAGGRLGAYADMGSTYKQRLIEHEQAAIGAGSTRNRL